MREVAVFLLCLFLVSGCFGNLDPLPSVHSLVAVRGKVIDAVTREGVEGAQVRLRDFPECFDLTASDGSFFLPRVPSGRQVFIVSSTGYAQKSEAVDVPAATSSFSLTIELAPLLGKLVGYVWGEEGNPLSGATVTVDGTYTTTTGRDGSFVLDNLPVGKVVLVVEKEGFVPYVEEIDIAHLAVTVVHVTLTRPSPGKV
ncbi:MAG: carboxypeptidase regulatory-like domain-containing protein [Candidatus Caldatribacterium sp.]|uniref:carboxypeptidase regulatory-like domain-containing protein n=1 Tax=Candidatus Caldatribacterium sp. TaxID=2282143 RepID=UPI002991A5F2|nr:carboxypeptidase regulatory-like domain-containing protein [Candidatus Caldatribacterium sp.]MCX7730418.1 carboxypeptidase regulatory-like domain-containing protein [Candidatus Caldatribacterium sp.]MDW8080975.1 carboxypeptidase regulatory-like domain-containing protein [Candidatus Calescibacterium sp.]